jgi:hypothetical protein
MARHEREPFPPTQGSDTVTQAFPMTDDPRNSLINPAEAAYLETEADRSLAPLVAAMPADVMALLRDVFIITAATDPEANRARKRARGAGPVARSGEAVKASADGAAANAKRNVR